MASTGLYPDPVKRVQVRTNMVREDPLIPRD